VQIVLDSWAVIAVWWNEPPGPNVVARVGAADHVLMSWINLGEVLYREARRTGDPSGTTARVKRFADTIHAEAPNPQRVIEAALWKSRGGLSYADAFAAATAAHHGAPLLTGDPELVALDGMHGVKVIDLRS